jgi:hypothetical protein
MRRCVYRNLVASASSPPLVIDSSTGRRDFVDVGDCAHRPDDRRADRTISPLQSATSPRTRLPTSGPCLAICMGQPIYIGRMTAGAPGRGIRFTIRNLSISASRDNCIGRTERDDRVAIRLRQSGARTTRFLPSTSALDNHRPISIPKDGFPQSSYIHRPACGVRDRSPRCPGAAPAHAGPSRPYLDREIARHRAVLAMVSLPNVGRRAGGGSSTPVPLLARPTRRVGLHRIAMKIHMLRPHEAARPRCQPRRRRPGT